MASSHGIPRVTKEGGGDKEKEQIREYRALIDSVNAKVRATTIPTTKQSIMALPMAPI
jgi:hypothetical protein